MKKNTVKITCDLEKAEYDVLKALCDKKGVSVEDYAKEVVLKKIKAFDESKNRKI